jgi:site-specific recombinase XerD
MLQVPAVTDTPAPALPVLYAAELDAARTFAEQEKAEATRRAYRSDMRAFAAWCRQRGAEPLPATAELVAAFLAWQAHAGAKASTIARRAAAISYAHRLAGMEAPTAAESVRAVMRGIRRSIGAAPDRKTPATAELVMEMLKHCPGTLAGKRDRALLALGFAGAFRRSELVALQVADLVEAPDGFRVVVRRSKTDQEGQGQEIAIPRGYRLRPVEAVQTWLAAAEISNGPVFRPVFKGSRVQSMALTHRSVAIIIKRYAVRVGLDPTAFSGHSLRSGFLTSAAESGASIFKMMEQSRHRSMDTLRAYVRSADLFREHAGAAFL